MVKKHIDVTMGSVNYNVYLTFEINLNKQKEKLIFFI